MLARILTIVATAALSSSVAAQTADVTAQMRSVLRYSGIENPTPDDVTRMSTLWHRAQEPGLTTMDRQAAFRDMFAHYARLHGRDVTTQPQALDGTARFAATIVERGGRMELTLPNPRGEPTGGHLHVETRGRGPIPLLLIADFGIDGRKLYGSFAERQGSAYTMHIVTLPFAGAARPLPWPITLDYSARPWVAAIERELLELVDQPQMRGVAVVGTSAGGYFAARLAILRPRQVRAAVLVNALVKSPIAGPPAADVRAASAQRQLLVRSIPSAPQLFPVAPLPPSDELRRLIADSASTHPSVQNWMAFAVRDTAMSRAWTFDALSSGFFLPANRYRWELTSSDLTEALARLTVPTLAISSRHDATSPMTSFPAISQWNEAKSLYPTIPLSTLVLEGTRHYASADAPQEFDRALAQLLAAPSPVAKPGR
jgi:pimeloyl-ACP methyl ester carboxylesterase